MFALALGLALAFALAAIKAARHVERIYCAAMADPRIAATVVERVLYAVVKEA